MRRIFSVCTLVLVACGGGGGDAMHDGGTDARVGDGSANDSSVSDAGTDARITDAGMDAVVVMGEPSALTGITDAHNAARANAVPTPQPALPAMTWSNTVATAAQIVANRCEFAHSGNGYGENIYASAGSTPTGQGVTSSWVSEAAHYDYADNTCDANEDCGHYTQVVWRTSVQLGCGIATCTQNSPFEDFPTWTLVVCDYSPAGNVNVDENRPY